MKKLLLLASIAAFSTSSLAHSAVNPALSNSDLDIESNEPVVSNVDKPTVQAPTPAVPVDTKAKIEGLFSFQSGFRNETNLTGDEKNVSANRKGFAFFTEAAIAATVSQTVNEITYGGKVVLVPTTKAKTSPSYNGSHLFVQSEFGKVEAGSPYDAGSKMRITGGDIVAGSDQWSNYPKFANIKSLQYTNATVTSPQEPEFIPYVDYFFDSSFKTKIGQLNDGTEPPRLVSYYTPKMHGFQVGVSFIPDSGNTGGGDHNVDTSPNKGVETFTIVPSVAATAGAPAVVGHNFVVPKSMKNAVATGLTYECTINDGVELKLAATGEYGKISKKAIETNGAVVTLHKVSDLKTYNLGAILTYGNLSYAASYGSLGKSFTFKEYHKTGRDTRYYNGAVAYTQGPIKASISYLKSQHFTNDVDAVTLGTHYKLTNGLLSHAEITYFQANGRPVYTPEAPKRKIKGTVALVGAKLSL